MDTRIHTLNGSPGRGRGNRTDEKTSPDDNIPPKKLVREGSMSERANAILASVSESSGDGRRSHRAEAAKVKNDGDDRSASQEMLSKERTSVRSRRNSEGSQDSYISGCVFFLDLLSFIL